MKTGFEIIENSTNDIVAVYYNEKGYRAFDIIETRDSYVSVNCINGIKSKMLSYYNAHKLCTDEERQLSTEEWKKKVLEHACEFFEEDYNAQVQKLYSML